MTRSLVIGAAAALLSCVVLGKASFASPPSPRWRVAENDAPVFCIEIYAPVCGRDKTGKRRTYGNDCEARRDGATDVTSGPCHD